MVVYPILYSSLTPFLSLLVGTGSHHLKELVIICTMRRIAGANPPHPCRLYSVPSPSQSHVPLNKENALLDLMLTPWIESGGI